MLQKGLLKYNWGFSPFCSGNMYRTEENGHIDDI